MRRAINRRHEAKRSPHRQYSHLCKQCHRNFSSNQPHATLCSNECRALQKHGWDSTRPSRQREKSSTTQLTTSAATGYSNELRVTQDLMHRGFHVATFNYAAPIDLIAYKNGHTITIEVKTGRRNPVTNKLHPHHHAKTLAKVTAIADDTGVRYLDSHTGKDSDLFPPGSSF